MATRGLLTCTKPSTGTGLYNPGCSGCLVTEGMLTYGMIVFIYPAKYFTLGERSGLQMARRTRDLLVQPRSEGASPGVQGSVPDSAPAVSGFIRLDLV